MINIEEFKAKVAVFTDRYEKIQEEMKASGGENGTWYESLDEDYDLVFMRVALVGTVVAITDKDWTPVFYYLEDEDWTVGDVLGGYLDLYFER